MGKDSEAGLYEDQEGVGEARMRGAWGQGGLLGHKEGSGGDSGI